MRQLCEYKDIFGKPREGVHALRVFDLAIFDIVGTFGLAYGLHKVTGYNYWKCVVFMFVLAIFLHWLFCVETQLNVTLGLI